MIRAVPLLMALAFVAAFVASVTTGSALAFEAGQRWSCVTDQGADAFLEVHDVDGESVSFSWGVLNPETNEFDRLCHKRDRLTVAEMSEFCRVLGDEFSEGHVMLHDGCIEEARQ